MDIDEGSSLQTCLPLDTCGSIQPVEESGQLACITLVRIDKTGGIGFSHAQFPLFSSPCNIFFICWPPV